MGQQPILCGPAGEGPRVAAARRWGTYLLLAALLGLLPVIVHLVRHHQQPAATAIEAWVYGALLVSGIQAAYAIYALLLPDWCTVGVSAVASLALAAGYAMLTGAALLAPEQGGILQRVGLGHAPGEHEMAGWCLLMLTITGLLAFAGGQLSGRWRHHFHAPRRP